MSALRTRIRFSRSAKSPLARPRERGPGGEGFFPRAGWPGLTRRADRDKEGNPPSPLRGRGGQGVRDSFRVPGAPV